MMAKIAKYVDASPVVECVRIIVHRAVDATENTQKVMIHKDKENKSHE